MHTKAYHANVNSQMSLNSALTNAGNNFQDADANCKAKSGWWLLPSVCLGGVFWLVVIFKFLLP